MTEFPELKGVLRAWAIEAISRLSADDDARDTWIDFGRWRRDSDGIFRDIDREVEGWNRRLVVAQFDLPQWDAVLGALQSDVRLARQIGTLVGTAHGGRRVEAETIGRITLPRPAGVSQLDEAFERRYALYLTGKGDEKYRGKLRYRLAQRAALWADPGQVGYSKCEVFDIMKSAYNARSAIAHGGAPNGLAFGHRRTSDDVVTRRNAVRIVTYVTPDACMRA